MKKWISNLPLPASEDTDKNKSHSKDSLKTVIDEEMTLRIAAEKQVENIYDHLENYRESPSTLSGSHGDYAMSSCHSVPSEYSCEDPFYETGMFSGPVTDLDEDSDPDEIKVYNPTTKTISIRKSNGNNVNVNISVSLAHLEQDIQQIIDEMVSLDQYGSVRSNSSHHDSGIDLAQAASKRINNDMVERQMSKTAPGGKYGEDNRKLYWIGSEKQGVQNGPGGRDFLNVTCLVNENFDEDKVFKSSMTGIPLGFTPGGSSLCPPKEAIHWGNQERPYLKMPRHRNPPYPPSPRRNSGWKTCCTVFVLVVAVMLAGLSYFSVANVQSTLRAEFDIGIIALITEKASNFVCVLFIPAVITRWPGRKWGAALGALLGAAWPGAQLAAGGGAWGPALGAAVGAAAAQGLAEALLWGAALPLVVEAVEWAGGDALALAVATLHAAWQLGQVGAGVLTTAVLVGGNASWLPEPDEGVCGLRRCGAAPPPDAAPLADALDAVWLPLLGPPFAAALLLAAALRAPSRTELCLDSAGPGGRHGLLPPLQHLGGLRQLLLLPCSALSGMLAVAFSVEVTKEMSGCAWGGARAGLGPALAALCHAAAAVLLSPLAARRAGRATALALLALLLAVGGAAVACPWAASASAPQRHLLPVGLAGAGAALDALAAATAVQAFPERRTMAITFLLAARAAGALLQLALARTTCLGTKLVVLGCALLLTFACSALQERLWGAEPASPQSSPGASQRSSQRSGQRSGQRSTKRSSVKDDGMVEVPLDRPGHW